jgi:hypothetical protein
MPRNMDLVREILFALEENSYPQRLKEKGYTTDQIGYHIHIMGEAGLVNALDITALGAEYFVAMPNGLTWSGHEFLDAAREQSLWQKAMDMLRSKGVPMTIEIVKTLLIQMAMEKLGKSKT